MTDPFLPERFVLLCPVNLEICACPAEELVTFHRPRDLPEVPLCFKISQQDTHKQMSWQIVFRLSQVFPKGKKKQMLSNLSLNTHDLHSGTTSSLSPPTPTFNAQLYST